MTQIAIWTANTGLFVLCCWLVAAIINTAADHALAPEPAALIPDAPAPAAEPRARASRAAILDRNLFNVSTLLGPVVAEAALDVPLEETQLPLRLLGTAASSLELLSWAAVEDLESHKHVVVKLQDRLQEKATVVAIDRGRIVLDNSGRQEQLTLGDDENGGSARPAGRPAPRAAARSVPPDLGARLRQLTQNRDADPGNLEVAGRSAAELFSSARILPKYEAGQMVGIQLNAVKPGSLFEDMGIQNGDIITQVNGIQINSPQGSAEVLRELTESERFELLITGPDGAARTLTYQVEAE